VLILSVRELPFGFLVFYNLPSTQLLLLPHCIVYSEQDNSNNCGNQGVSDSHQGCGSSVLKYRKE